MDGVSIAASIIGIATAGAQVSIKLVTLATQISTASDRVSAIGNDISLTSSVLRQLGDLMTENIKDRGITILNPDGLENTKTAAAMCERIFSEMEKEVKKASEQLRSYKPGLEKMRAQKIELSTTEKFKWPFLQPRLDSLRTDLRGAKSTLILLLQVANLALNKRMANASMSASEYQDLIRAVVALEFDRREEPANVTAQQGVSGSPSSDDAPDVGSSNRIPPGETVLKLDQNRSTFASGTQIGPTYDPEATISLKDLPVKRKRGSPDATASPVAGPSKIPRPPGIMEVPQKTFPGRNSTINAIIDPPRSPLPSGPPNSPELKLFLLKPIVRDLFDRIELRWTVQDTNMQPQAIREYMGTNVKDEILSVVEMLQQLHAYEQEMVDAQMPKDSGRSMLSLRRKTIDIRARDMLFRAVPGLEFVVQCHVDELQSRPNLSGSSSTYSGPTPPTYDVDLPPIPSMQPPPLLEVYASQAATAAPAAEVAEKKSSPKIQTEDRTRKRARPPKAHLESVPSPPKAYLESVPSEDEDVSPNIQTEERRNKRRETQPRGQAHGYARRLKSQGERDAASVEHTFDYLDDFETAEVVPDEEAEAEAEAEAMVNALLKQYTTLFDS